MTKPADPGSCTAGFFFALPPNYVSIDENDDHVLSFFNTTPSNDDYKVVYN